MQVGPRWFGATCIVLTFVGCGGDAGDTGLDGSLAINNGQPDQADTVVVAGERIVDPERTVTFGIGTLENIGAEDITVLGVEPMETFGDIELVDAIISGRDRESLWIAADDSFPPDADLGTTAPLAGYTLTPPTTPDNFPSVNVLMAYRIGDESAVAGVLGACVDYTVGDGEPRRQCWPGHHLVACEDIDAPDCTSPDD